MSDELLLELSNGAGALLDLIFIAILGLYLFREGLRRKLSFSDWLFRLPPNMHFAVAVLVYDTSVMVRSSAIWIWRRFYGAGEFPPAIQLALVLGAYGMVIGMLCKIRSISKPDYGDLPWMASAWLVLLFVAVSLLFR